MITIFIIALIAIVLIVVIAIVRKRKLENDRTIVFNKDEKKDHVRRYKNGVEILPSEYTKEELKKK